MYRLIILAIFFTSFVNAQTKKPATKLSPAAAKAAAIRDSLRKDSLLKNVKVEEVKIPREFAVYSKKSVAKPGAKSRQQLCVNLVSDTTIFNYCINDSILKDPEVSKILFQKKQADSTYVLVYVQAFSKPDDKPTCDAGKEIKLFFVRWNTKTNKALVKQKTVESCMKSITNMSKEGIESWDNSSPLIFNYHRGGQNYIDLKFDPQNYLLGLQSNNSGD